MTYDQNGRLLRKDWEGGYQAWTYDALGRILSTVDHDATATNNVSYTYNATGRILTETQNGKTVSYVWDLVGNKVTVTYPSNKVVTYEYTGTDRIASVSLNGTLLASYSYDGRNLLTGEVLVTV